MATDPNSTDLKREIQATLAARRELGPDFDDHFLDRLVEQIKGNSKAPVPAQPPGPPSPHALSSEQRTGIAICSLIFGIPLVAISLSSSFAAFALVVLLILGINFTANFRN